MAGRVGTARRDRDGGGGPLQGVRGYGRLVESLPGIERHQRIRHRLLYACRKAELMAGSLLGAHRDRCKYLIWESVCARPLAEFFEQFPFEFGSVTGERLEYSPVAM